MTEGLTIPSEATFFFNPSVCSLHSHPPPLSGQAYCVELALTKTLPSTFVIFLSFPIDYTYHLCYGYNVRNDIAH